LYVGGLIQWDTTPLGIDDDANSPRENGIKS